MTSGTLRIELLSYWHAGTGLRRGGDADALVLHDTAGLPYLPGRTVKGLLREGVCLAASCASGLPKNADELVFGREDRQELLSRLVVGDAKIPDDKLGQWLRKSEDAVRETLFDSIASTALTDNGLAKDNSLRVVEVCLPLTLVAGIKWDETILDPALGTVTATEVLQTGALLIRSLGSHRHRGLGRCAVELVLQP